MSKQTDNLTWNDVIVMFMDKKTERLLENGLEDKELYFDNKDKEEILSWPEETCKRIVKKIVFYCKHHDALSDISGLSWYMCPFCLYCDMMEYNCSDCKYAKNHNGDCALPFIAADASDIHRLYLKFGQITFQNILTAEFYQKTIESLIKLKEEYDKNNKNKDKFKNYIRYKRKNDELEDIIEYLPSGSGFDTTWEVEYKGKYLKLISSYHVMNNNGYYVGWADFSVIIPLDNPLDFRLHFHGERSHYLNKQYLLRDYIEDMLYCYIEEMLEKINNGI